MFDNKENKTFSLASCNLIINNSVDAVFIYDRIGKITNVNQKVCELLGYSKEFITSKNINYFLSEGKDYPKKLDDFLQRTEPTSRTEVIVIDFND